MKTFALIGAGGYVAPRHMRAIRDLGGSLVLAHDHHDSVGVLDAYAPHARFVTEPGVFWAKLRQIKPDYLVICTPNDTHVDYAVEGMRAGCDVICEKPVALQFTDVADLREVERMTKRRVWTTHQLRVHPSALLLRDWLEAHQPPQGSGSRASVQITYTTYRGPWYHESWKGDPTRSGGLLFNIGIHLFDLAVWLFGGLDPAHRPAFQVRREGKGLSGMLELERARVDWRLSTDEEGPSVRRVDVVLGDGLQEGSQHSVDLAHGFTDLHTLVYAQILAGRGTPLSAVAPSVSLVNIMQGALSGPS